MKISLLYYSGAGNTKFFAKKIFKALKSDSTIDVKMTKITDRVAQNFDEEYDMLIIGFPIYDLTAPQSVRYLVENLKSSSKPISFFCTKAFASADSIAELSKVSREKGLRTVAKREFYMPGTDTLGLFAKKDSKTEKVLKFFHSRNIDKKIEDFIEKIKEQKEIKTSQKWYTKLSFLIPQKWKNKFHEQYSRFVPEFYSQTDLCIECMKCVKGCPRENIIFNTTIQFGLECDMCLHCLHHCPTDSIQIGDYTKGTVRYAKVEV